MAATSGSSPLARGLRVRGRLRGCEGGIIPARAGFTVPGVEDPVAGPDHPRSRGVYGDPDYYSRNLTRIIPARAGFTHQPRVLHPGGRDHPRSRGVYQRSKCGAVRRSGSSPLARGLQGPVLRRVRGAGIIPARAGFTRRPTPTRAGSGDHPRSRGVYGGAGQTLQVGHGIIPARAGFTGVPGRHAQPTGDHPRSRGVYVFH